MEACRVGGRDLLSLGLEETPKLPHPALPPRLLARTPLSHHPPDPLPSKPRSPRRRLRSSGMCVTRGAERLGNRLPARCPLLQA